MLHSTLLSRVVFQNPAIPRVLKRMTPSRMELTLILLKERKKKIRYLGSAFQQYGDRFLMYNARGGVRRGTRFIIERHHTRAQYCHPGYHSDRYNVRSIKTGGAQYDQLGNITRMTWDASTCTTNLLNDPTFKRMFSCLRKEEAISTMEEWGVRYVLLDEIRKPSLMDCKYHRHSIYANKFSWSSDPETNHYKGDAEYKWKGDEEIDYRGYNAQSSHPANFSNKREPMREWWNAGVSQLQQGKG